VVSLPPPAKYEPGALILGKYRLERMLGEGGMGSVWAAHHVPLDTAVAIKLIRSDTNRQELAPRLMQEARAAAKLGHPAIVRVFDVGQTAEGEPFIVMELLEGESLNQRLEREHRLSAVEAARLLLPIADALRAAHAKGIVHRDIKPDNVFLVTDETGVQPKLVDFGIAKLAAREFDSQLTQQGVIVGSPDYMAPEQARGEEDIDRRADIWAFCVLLYETVSGQPPFDGPNYNALLHAILEATPEPLTTMCAGDAEFSSLVETGLAKDRTQRWQTMQELGEALARWLVKQGVFEDAAGGAIEAKWIHRRGDSGQRQSRPSFGSIPGFAATMPGLERATSSSTVRRLAAEAPTSFGPVVAPSERWQKRRLILPLALAFGVTAALSAHWLRPSAESARPKVSAAGTATASAQPPSTVAAPVVVPEPIPIPAALNTEEPVPGAMPSASAPAQKLMPSRTHARPTAPDAPTAHAAATAPTPAAATAPALAAASAAPSAPKPAHDLLTPY
jgi:serine/threonine-protein kinase